MPHSSEQRPQTSNSQLSRITLSGPTDRTVGWLCGEEGGGGGGGGWTEKRLC